MVREKEWKDWVKKKGGGWGGGGGRGGGGGGRKINNNREAGRRAREQGAVSERLSTAVLCLSVSRSLLPVSQCATGKAAVVFKGGGGGG